MTSTSSSTSERWPPQPRLKTCIRIMWKRPLQGAWLAVYLVRFAGWNTCIRNMAFCPGQPSCSRPFAPRVMDGPSTRTWSITWRTRRQGQRIFCPTTLHGQSTLPPMESDWGWAKLSLVDDMLTRSRRLPNMALMLFILDLLQRPRSKPSRRRMGL
ncbi:hypothetical protein EMPG_17678 [Blastomyces silverae]|uniref:Uncharacterized protein n=1 Tax=Blastomyces silverae TaxID=2060906 RepID=A0A0H1B788_9EURO|nr:hypothetical protein EMPG_17678 [Blastomyces silverae]